MMQRRGHAQQRLALGALLLFVAQDQCNAQLPREQRPDPRLEAAETYPPDEGADSPYLGTPLDPTQRTVLVSTDVELMQALRTQTVDVIRLRGVSFTVAVPPSRNPVFLNRSVLIDKDPLSPTGYPLVTINSSRAAVSLPSTSTLTLRNLRIMGMNKLLDERPYFLTGGSSGRVVLDRCVVYRVACLPPEDLLYNAQQGANGGGGPYASPIGPDSQPKLATEDRYCIPSMGDEYCFSNAVVFQSLTLVMTRQLPGGSSGGGSAGSTNITYVPDGVTVQYDYTVLLCDVFVDAPCSSERGASLEACIEEIRAKRRVPPPPPPPPHMLPPSPPPPRSKGVEASTVLGAAIGGSVGGVALVALIALGFYVWLRRRPLPPPAFTDLEAKSLAVAATATHPTQQHNSLATAASDATTDTSQGTHSRKPGAAGVPLDASGNTAMTSGSVYGGGAGAAGPWPALAVSNPADPVNAIQLQLLLGAGSFGSVYKGYWRGHMCAIKIIPHAKQATDKIRNEVNLCLGFNHANVVKALYCETLDSVGVGGALLPTSLSLLGSSSIAGGNRSSATFVPVGSLTASGSTAMAGPNTSSAAQTWLVMEYCNGGSLAAYVTGGDDGGAGSHGCSQGSGAAAYLGEMRSVLGIARDIAAGMVYLHSQRLCHGDLKPENVLLSIGEEAVAGSISGPSPGPASGAGGRNGVRAKVADFGLSRTLTDNNTTAHTATIGTVTHMPPELLRSGALKQSGDVYAFGIILWQLVVRRPLYMRMRMQQVVVAVTVDGLRPEFPSTIPERYVQLAKECWATDPDQRPNFPKVYERLCELHASAEALQAEYDMALAKHAATGVGGGGGDMKEATSVPDPSDPPNPFAAAGLAAGLAALSL